MVTIIRSSFELVAPQAEALGRHFYAMLFSAAPATRDLFPVNMEVQRSRFLRAMVHVVQMVDRPAELTPFLAQLGRDHRKFGVIAKHYAAFGGALLGAMERFAGPAWTPDVAKAWGDAYAAVAGAMRSAAEAETGPAYWIGRVVEHRRLGWDLAIIRCRPASSSRTGRASTSASRLRSSLGYGGTSRPPTRRGATARWSSTCGRSREAGSAGRSLRTSRMGDMWRLGPPMGRMNVDRGSGRPLLMVAGGTGVAPVKALLEDFVPVRRRGPAHAGLRRRPPLGGPLRLRRLAQDVLRQRVARRRPGGGGVDDSASGAEIGTLADVVSRYGAWADHDVIVAGSPAMIRATVSRMLVAGTALDRIQYDPFTVD